MMKRTVVVTFALAAMSCRNADSRAATDSTLQRDLALAGQSSAEPQLNDTALTPPQATTPPKAKAPTMSEVAPAQPPFRGIPAGATFALTTKGAICTTNLAGDKITATITADVDGDNGAVIPGGSTVVLEVVQVTPGSTPESATITLRIRSVIVNDQPVAVPSDVSVTSQLERHTMPRDRGADRRKVVGGAVAGAIVGQILGKDTKSTVTGAAVGAAAGAATAAATGTKYDACLPAGGTLRATTREPVPLTATQ
ncbi:MAG: hypothetical protein AABZ80_00830 [Gemmatimonadota bacterium]